MQATVTLEMSGIAHLERALSSSIADAAERLPDQALAGQVRSFAEAHARHAEVLEAMLHRLREMRRPPEEYQTRATRLAEGLRQAEAVESVLVALVQAERAIVDLYEVPLAEDLGAEDAKVLRAQQRTEQRHVDYLESRGAFIVPELADLGGAGGKGYSVP